MSEMTVLLGFDMETDIGSFTPFYEGVTHGTPRLLDLLKDRDVPATFYFTGDCVRKNEWVAPAVRDAGHEVGCHSLYHETVGDPIFEIPGVPPLLPEEVHHRLEIATDWVTEAAGERPVSFRAPRLFGSTAMVNALEQLNYLTDASYPMYYHQHRLTPYHPSREDWTEVGDLRILELPNFADLSINSSDPYGRDCDQWPRFRTESADALLTHIDRFSAYCQEQGESTFLAFYLHPWEFHEMPTGGIPFGEVTVFPEPFIVKNCGSYALEQLDHLIVALQQRGAKFCRACDLAV